MKAGKAEPFAEALSFFQDKVNLPTEHWNDLWQGMHSKAFMVAGATSDELLSDFHGSIEKALRDGTTLEDFQKEFDSIVKRHGWSYNGERGWRSSVIYDTNLTQAYNAGRYKQQMDPDLLKARPYREYRHGDSINPRPEHLVWHGLVLPADDPWWDTHYPANGWGCKCSTFMLSDADLEREGKSGPDAAPEIETYDWADPTTGEIRKVPVGIDPGFDYNPGQAAGVQPSAKQLQLMSEMKAAGKDAWQSITPGNWQSAGRPELVPSDKTATRPLDLGRPSIPEMTAALTGILGGPTKTYTTSIGGVSQQVCVDADKLAQHIDPARARFLPFLPEVLEDPFEVWMTWQRNTVTGAYALRLRYIKSFDLGGKDGRMFLVADANGGLFTGWTFVPTGRPRQLNEKLRQGRLLWGRE